MSRRLLIEQIETDRSLANGEYDFNKEVVDSAKIAAKECRAKIYNDKDLKAFVMGMGAVAKKFGGLPPYPQIIVDSWLNGLEDGILFGKYLKKCGYDVNNDKHHKKLLQIGGYLDDIVTDEYFPMVDFNSLGIDDDEIDDALSTFWSTFATSVMSNTLA